jgi:hypothetical protein
MRRVLFMLLGGCLSLLWPSGVSAWNEVGHAVVARIAYEELGKDNPKLQLQLFEMLKKHPHYEQFLAKNRPDGASPAEWALLRASNWPDWVRPPFRDGDKPDPQRVRYHRAFDHFINKPIVVTEGPNAYEGKVPPFDPDKLDIHAAFRQRMGELSEPLAAADDKAVALCWIAHLVGDVHQPLHAGTLISKQFPDGDLGGNRFGATVAGAPIRLHTYWDNLMGEVPGWENDTADHQAQVYALVVKTTEGLRDPQYARSALAEPLTRNATFASWIDESHELAKTVAYRNGDTLIEAVVLKTRGAVPENAPDVGPGYDERAHQVARLRVAQAGYRLADKLKVILARQPAD